MADGVTFQSAVPATPPDLTIVATDDAGAAGHVQLFKLAYSANGVATLVPADVDGLLVNLGANNDVTVAGVATQATLASILSALGTPLQAGGTVALDAAALAALETITVALDAGSLAALESITATGPLTDTQLRASAVPVSGSVTATGPLTDAQLRATAVPVSGTVAVTGVATAANQTTELTDLGGVTEAAPATDTASSGLNGRLQRIAQRLTSLIALLPASLGQTTKAGSVSVALASDSDALTVSGTVTATGTLAATQSGTWTVQPGNTANTTAWKVDGSAVTQPVSGSVTTTPTTATTATLTSTNDSASSVTVQASNAARKGLILYNDSTQPAYVKFGATASATSFSVYLPAAGTYFMGPSIYSGIVDAIWAADASGAMRATEW